MIIFLFYLCILYIVSLEALKNTNANKITQIIGSNYEVLYQYKRYNTYFTEGIFFDTSHSMIESGGQYGSSTLVKYEFPNNNVIDKQWNLPSTLFGEGDAMCGNYVYQLTWKERLILQYDYPALNFIQYITMDPLMTAGWGLTNYINNQMIASDGTSTLYFLDCNNNLKVTNTISVVYNGTYLDQLNGLGYANGYVYANRFYDYYIFKIDPTTGNVVQAYDFLNLINLEISYGDITTSGYYYGYVLNGIAYNRWRGTFFITGKMWGNFYEVILQ